MIKPCARCKNQRADNELRNIRGNEEVEGYFAVHNPEILLLSENDPIEVCVDCLRELNAAENNNSESIQNKSPPNRPQRIVQESDDVQLQSESVTSVLNAPYSSSLVKNGEQRRSLDLDILNRPGEIEKLAPNNRNLQRNIRQLMAKSMPVAAKKRKLSEMLENIPIPPALEQRRPNDEAYGNDIFANLMNQSGRIVRRYRDDSSSINSSQSDDDSQEKVKTRVENLSSQKVVQLSNEIAALPLSPIISARNQTPVRPATSGRTQPPVPLYEHDTSSESSGSDRISNSNLPNDNGPRRRSSGRVPSINSSSDDGQAARRSDDGQTARRSADRRQNDGNNHSNLAAPRRIQMPAATGHQQVSSKSTNGG